MTRECFIKEDGVRYSEVDGAEMRVDYYGIMSFPPSFVIDEYREKYPYLLKSEEKEKPTQQIRLIDGKLYFLLDCVSRNNRPKTSVPHYEKTYVFRELGENAGPIQRLKRQGEIIGYFETRVEERPDSYFLYWHPIKENMLTE